MSSAYIVYVGRSSSCFLQDALSEALQRLQGRDIVCLTVRCSILPKGYPSSAPEDPDPDDAPKPYTEARTAVIESLCQWAGSIPTLQYLSFEMKPESRKLRLRAGPSTLRTAMMLTASGTPLQSTKLPELAFGETESFWWEINKETRACTAIASAVGERIAQFLRSPSYHWNEDLDPQLREAVLHRYAL